MLVRARMGVRRIDVAVHFDDPVVKAQVLGDEPADPEAVLLFPLKLHVFGLDEFPAHLPAPPVGLAPLLPPLKQRGTPLLPSLFALIFRHLFTLLPECWSWTFFP